MKNLFKELANIRGMIAQGTKIETNFPYDNN